MEEEHFLNIEEKRMFEDFAVGLDTAIVNKYHGVLQDVKVNQKMIPVKLTWP
jgi:hypothetical protein